MKARGATKHIKLNKGSILKKVVLNALLMISLNGQQPGTLQAKELIINTARIYGERNQYEKVPGINQNEEGTQTISKQNPSDAVC